MQPRGEILANNVAEKGVVSIIYSELLNSAGKKQPNAKNAKRCPKQFTKRAVQVETNTHGKLLNTVNH